MGLSKEVSVVVRRRWLFLLLGLVTGLLGCLVTDSNSVGSNLDFIQLGDEISEVKHNVAAHRTRITTGGLRELCRQIEPGGEIAFTLRCDPTTQNYLTVNFGAPTRNLVYFSSPMKLESVMAVTWSKYLKSHTIVVNQSFPNDSCMRLSRSRENSLKAKLKSG